MKVLLVSMDAKYIHTNNAVRLLQANSSFDVDILEYTIKDDIDDILSTITKYTPDVLGLSVYIWNVEQIKTLLQRLSLPNTTIILGGPEVSYDPEPFLRLPGVTIVIKGEGELAFEQVLQRLNENQSFQDLSNIAWFDDNGYHNNPIEEITDLSSLNLPYFRLEDRPHIPHKISYIESSRGCPFQCSYCLSSLEKTVRFFPVNSVTNAISYLMEHGSKTIKFLDRTFNANRHTMDILKYIINHDNLQTVFQFEITGDILQQDIIDYIHTHARPGLFRFEIGIQSTNDRTNHLVDRHQNTKALFDTICKIQDANIIDLHLDLIAGLPEEDKDSFVQTFNDVYRLGAKELQLGFLKMLRGTKIRYQADRFGYLYHTTAPYEIISNKMLSQDDIQEIKLVEHMLEIYHNKGYFGENLHTLILNHPSPYHFFLTIGLHYQANGYAQHGYQMKDVYSHLIELLTPQETFVILQDYLLRSHIKPERFFEQTVTKSQRALILQDIANQHNIPLHKLYKHSVILLYEAQYFCAYYQHHTCIPFKGKAPN